MNFLTTTAALAIFCNKAADFDYITIDTEFIRERTYYSKLCLIQLAYPHPNGNCDPMSNDSAALIDPLAINMDLTPLYTLFKNPNVVKVFHAARQDLEIFYTDRQIFPSPFFDTQIAAMVCGYGEQVGYETLVNKIVKQPLDKLSRFTDWAVRPLSWQQKTYALADVTHLCLIYEHLNQKLQKYNRKSWLKEELDKLFAAETYITQPYDAYKKIKVKTQSPFVLARIKELAAFREIYAQNHNIPCNRVMKNNSIIELAVINPCTKNDLKKSRFLSNKARRGNIADGILTALQRAARYKNKDMPKPRKIRKKKQNTQALVELLRVMLKAKAASFGVAQKLIASSAELDEIAIGVFNGSVFTGWRAEVFGNDALRLCQGTIALGSDGKVVKLIEI